MTDLTSFCSRNLVSAAVVCGGLFVGYCIYFDKKRRSHPDYKKNLRKRRLQQEQARKDALNQYPDLTNPSSVQAFLMDNMSKGDDCIAMGNIEKGVEHFANVVAVCPQPETILEFIRQNMPPSVFLNILQKVPEIKMKIHASQKKGRLILQAAQSSMHSQGLMIDDDLE